MDALVKQRLASDKSLKTYDDAFEEVVADSCESFLRDAALSEKAEQLYKKSPETANAFVKFFKKIIEKIKYYYSGIHPQSQEGRIVSEWKDSLNERLQLFIDGVNAAARNLSNKENSTNDGGVKYQNRTSNDDAIKTQLKENQELLAKESIVADVVTPQHFDNARKAKEWAVEYLKSSGYRVERQNFGTIVFTEKQINKALNYLNTNEEAAAFACLPRVLKRGLIISGHNNHKGRGFDTVTIAGAVKINGVRGNMAVVVKLEKGDNKYRMHRILMPDGSKFVFDDKTKTEPTPSGATTSAVTPTISPVSTSIISDSTENINREFSDIDTKFSIRQGDPPTNTITGYKAFRVKDGKLYPPMVANPGGADTPVGVWLNADIGERAPDSKTGRAQVKGKGGMSLSFRPGWHLGETPRASQFDRMNPETGVKDMFPSDFVWAECDCAADVDYQDEAMSESKYTLNITERMLSENSIRFSISVINNNTAA